MSSAAASQELQDTPLTELIGGSAGLGRWMLKVARAPWVSDYKYQWDGKTVEGKAFTVLMLSHDTTQYCYGKFTRRGDAVKAEAIYKKTKDKLQDTGKNKKFI